MDNKVKFSWITALQKAGINTGKQMLIWLLGLFLANPGLVLGLLGSWKDMTIGGVIVFLGNLLYNYLKNKNLGK